MERCLEKEKKAANLFFYSQNHFGGDFLKNNFQTVALYTILRHKCVKLINLPPNKFGAFVAVRSPQSEIHTSYLSQFLP